MYSTKTLLGLMCTLVFASAPGWAADDLLTIQMVEEARQWQMKDRDDLAAEIWRKLLRANPKHPEALAKLAAIEGRAGNTGESEAYLSRIGAVAKQVGQVKPPVAVKETPSKVPPAQARSENLGALEVVIRDNSKAPAVSVTTLGSLQTSNANKNRPSSRQGLEKLVRESPGDPRYATALARHLTNREKTRREGLRQLDELTSRGQGTAETRSTWRRALILLHAGPQDAELFRVFLKKFPEEPVVLQRLRSLGGPLTQDAAVPAVVPVPVSATSNQTKALALLESGRALAKIGDADSLARAREQLENGMLLDPANAAVRLELARVYQALGLLDRSASLVDSVLDSQPDASEALYTRALLYAAQENWSDGLEVLERIPGNVRTSNHAVMQQKMWVSAQVQRARQLFGVGNFKQALELMEQAQDGARQDTALMTLVAGGWSDMGQSTKALALMRTLRHADTVQAAEVRIKYAEVLLNAQQDAELIALLKDLSAPGNLPTHQQNQLNPIILGYTLRVTETLRESGRLAEAADVLSPALQRVDDVRLLTAMARIYQSAGNLDAAMELVERAIVREPNDLSHRLFASEIALVGNDLDRAQAYAKFALELAPLHPRALTAMGRVEKARGNAKHALEYFQQSQIQESKKPEFPFATGKLAVRLINDANVTSSPQREMGREVETNRSSLLPVPNLGERKEQQLATGNRETNVSQLQYGLAFLAEGDLLSAESSYSAVLKVNPADPVALNNLAVVKVAAGEYLSALQLFTQSSKVAPYRGDIQDNLYRFHAWLRAYTGVKTVAGGFDPYIATPPPLWSVVPAAGLGVPTLKPLKLSCKVKPCK